MFSFISFTTNKNKQRRLYLEYSYPTTWDFYDMEVEDYHAPPTSPLHTQPREVHHHEQEYPSTLPIPLVEEELLSRRSSILVYCHTALHLP